jgi:hypothetical protein
MPARHTAVFQFQDRSFAMLENEGVALKAIRWSEIFPWLSIGKSFRLAIGPRPLVYGAAALLLTLGGWYMIAYFFQHDGMLNDSWREAFGDEKLSTVIDRGVPNQPFAADRELLGMNEAAEGGPVSATVNKLSDTSGLTFYRVTPLSSAWLTLTRPMLRLFSIGSPASAQPMTVGDFCAVVLSSLWALMIWSFFGAAISRVAAVELAVGERIGWAASLRWARRKWLAYFASPVVPMIGVTLISLPIALLGLLMRSNFFVGVAGIVWPLVLFAAFLMTLLLVGVLLGWPLMWATVSVEGTDSFDALSRTYAYVFQKPLRYAVYIAIAVIIGLLGWFVVENFAAAVIWLASWEAGWGSGAARMEGLRNYTGDSWLANGGAALILFWNGCIKLLALGYVFSYFGVSSTAIYYQLRRDVDARETDEVFLDADESEQGFGLPKLTKDAAGAPEIAGSPVPAGDGRAAAEAVE